nr:MAG TPA: helix-turn-helix domain protein [Bacteriophage sp.]
MASEMGRWVVGLHMGGFLRGLGGFCLLDDLGCGGSEGGGDAVDLVELEAAAGSESALEGGAGDVSVSAELEEAGACGLHLMGDRPDDGGRLVSVVHVGNTRCPLGHLARCWEIAQKTVTIPSPCGPMWHTQGMGTQATNPGVGLNAAAAAVLRELREQQHITMRALSTSTGIPLRTLTRLLQADRSITFDPLCALAEALGVSVSTIVSLAEERLREEQRVPQFSC